MATQIDQFSNLATTALNGSIDAVTTTITVNSSVGFPAKTQFRIGVDSELMLVTAISGNTWTVTRGIEGTTASPHSIGSGIQHVFTAGIMSKLLYHSLGCYNHFEFFPQDIKNPAQIADNIQNGMLQAQLEALNLSDKSLSDLMPRSAVDYVIPYNKAYIQKQLTIPEYVRAHFIGKHITDLRPGGFLNQYEPTIVVPQRAHLAELNLLLNPDGQQAHQGAGVCAGKNWVASSSVLPVINQPGTGHAVNDIVTFPNPSTNPYLPLKYKVTSVNGSGGVTGLALQSAGAYALPPVLQARQWTTANGFTDFVTGFGSFAPPLFPQTATTGTGTGLVIDMTNAWAGDYDIPAFFNAGAFLISDIELGKLRIMGTGTGPLPYSSQYGFHFGLCVQSGNYVVDDLVTNFVGCGLYLRGCTDFHMRHFNPVKCTLPYSIFSGGSILIDQMVLDSCLGSGTIDQAQGIRLKGRDFFAIGNEGWGTPGAGSPAAFMIGGSSNASKPVCDVNLDFSLSNNGTLTGIAAAQIQYLTDSRINLDVSNYNENRALCDYKLNQFCIFGPGVDSSVLLTGKFDDGGSHLYATSSLFGGTVPNIGMDIWDATIPLGALSNTLTIGGTITNGNSIGITFTNAAISGLPLTKTYNVTGSDTLNTIASGLATIINSDTTLSAAQISATANGASLTITQNQIVNGSTVLSASITTGGTETVTFVPATGMLVAAAYGGKIREAGVYELKITGAPVANLGLNKCPTGSTALDKASGTRYTNTGTAAAPSWH